MALWTPASISTALWLDDTSIVVDGGVCTRWDDKSGNGRHAIQNTAASRPASTTVNGLTAALFDGSNDFLPFSESIFQPATTLLLVIVPTVEAAVGFAFGQWSSGVNGRLGVACNQTSAGVTTSGQLNPFAAPASDGAGSSGYTNHFPISNAATLVGLTRATAASENWKSYKNGVQQDSATAAYTATSVNSSLGSANAGTSSYPYDGKIAAVIVLHEVDTTKRQLCEGWLAWRYGFASSLPTDHPYYSAPPEEYTDDLIAEITGSGGVLLGGNASILASCYYPNGAIVAVGGMLFGGQALVGINIGAPGHVFADPWIDFDAKSINIDQWGDNHIDRSDWVGMIFHHDASEQGQVTDNAPVEMVQWSADGVLSPTGMEHWRSCLDLMVHI